MSGHHPWPPPSKGFVVTQPSDAAIAAARKAYEGNRDTWSDPMARLRETLRAAYAIDGVGAPALSESGHGFKGQFTDSASALTPPPTASGVSAAQGADALRAALAAAVSMLRSGEPLHEAGAGCSGCDSIRAALGPTP